VEATKQWYAIYTRTRWEKKISDLLTKRQIKNYCPINKVYRQSSDRKNVILQPLFTSYVFVYIDKLEQLSVRSTSGVINFVYWLSKPAIIPNEEIDIVRRYLNEFENVQLEKVQIKPDDVMRAISDPLMEQTGSVVSVKNNSLKILLPSLGYLMYAEVPKSNIEIMSSKESATF
jgi:transcription antitermination factor NusG